MEDIDTVLKPVADNTFLEEANTIDKVYVYGELPPAQEKSSPISTSSTSNPLSRCNFCKKTKNLKFCQCKSVKYCDRQCQK